MVATSVSSIGHRYEVPALLTEIAPQEGLLQAFDSLQTLDAVIADVFNRIQNRITEERTKISGVVARVSRAQEKVALIGQNSSRVTTIFSTAKYPAPKVLPDFKRVIEVDPVASALPPENNGLFLPPIRTQHKIAAAARFAPAPPADTSAIFTTLTTARLLRAEHAQADEETEIAEGLGRLPAYLPSISSVLLFNSDENPYKQYVTINNLEGVGGQDRVADTQGPSAAPKSLIDGLELPTYAGFQFEYKPLLGELPQFDLPQNLPLGKLADIAFGVDSSLSIAPSMATLALPSLDLPALPMPARTQQLSAVPSSTSTTSSVPASTGSSSVPVAPAPTSTSAPIAPPIAPPVTSSTAPTAPAGAPSAAAPQGVPKEVAKPSGGRGALLDAIRDSKNAKKLRSVKPGSGAPGAGRPTGGKKPGAKAPAGAGGDSATGGGDDAPAAKAPPASDPGDMMSALRERLARRATAISGKQEAVEGPKPMAARRLSVAPRLGQPPTPANKPKAASTDSVAEGDESGGAAPAGDGKMSSAVLSAYVSAHAKAKQEEKDEEWD